MERNKAAQSCGLKFTWQGSFAIAQETKITDLTKIQSKSAKRSPIEMDKMILIKSSFTIVQI